MENVLKYNLEKFKNEGDEVFKSYFTTNHNVVFINKSLRDEESIRKLFEKNNIPFLFFCELFAYEPEELSVSFGDLVEPKAIYFITYLLSGCLFGNRLNIYIHYAEDNKEYINHGSIFIGRDIKKNVEYINQSRCICPLEILELNLDDKWSLDILFPNKNKRHRRGCLSLKEERKWSERQGYYLAEDEYHYEDYDQDNQNDWGRDTFDALTDGNYGSYEDWLGSGEDLGELYDRLGY